MACDSCWTHGDFQVTSLIKIKRLSSGALLGQSGDNDARAIEALLDKVKKAEQLPSKIELAQTKDDFEGLLVLPNGQVFCISSGPVDETGWPVADSYDERGEVGVWPVAGMGGYAAIGSGGEAALSAMDADADARRAVEIACRRNINCRGPIHVRKLYDESHPAPKSRVRRGKAK
jgi:hypothetical protein